MPNFLNLVFRVRRSPVRLSGRISAQYGFMERVLVRSGPLKIARAVVVADAIYVIDLVRVGWRATMKRCAYKACDLELLARLAIASGKRDNLIAVLDPRVVDFAGLHRHAATMRTDAIHASPASYITPFFGILGIGQRASPFRLGKRLRERWACAGLLTGCWGGVQG